MFDLFEYLFARNSSGGSADLTPIAEALEAAGITAETTDMDGIIAAMATIEDKIMPWEHLPNTGTDLLGDYVEVTVNNTPNISKNAGYLRLKKNYPDVLLYPENTYGGSMDLTNFRDSTFRINHYTIEMGGSMVGANGASRVILPELYPVYTKPVTNRLSTYQMCSVAPVAVYLSKKMSDPAVTLLSSWISSQNNNVTEQFVKCPKDTEIPYFLNRMHKLTADSMVGLFENMIDRSGETTVATLTLGSENLGRLTEEQKNIAYAKGWTLA